MTVSPADSRDAEKSSHTVSAASQAPATQPNQPSDQQADPANASSGPRQQPGGEEPEMALEPDLPSDGRDYVGEAMIRDLPQRSELSEPPSQPNPSRQPT